jgi:hypothetical protein
MESLAFVGLGLIFLVGAYAGRELAAIIRTRRRLDPSSFDALERGNLSRAVVTCWTFAAVSVVFFVAAVVRL